MTDGVQKTDEALEVAKSYVVDVPGHTGDRVRLGNYAVPVSWVVSCARRSCGACYGRGLVRVAGAKVDELCGCAVLRAQAQIASFVRQSDPPKVVAVVALAERGGVERDRAARRLDRLRKELANVREELARKEARLRERVAGEREALDGLRIELNDANVDRAAALESARAMRLEADRYERQVTELRAAAAQADEDFDAADHRIVRLVAAIDPRERAIARATENSGTVALTKQAATIERRIRAVLGEFPDLGAEPGPGLNEDAAPAPDPRSLEPPRQTDAEPGAGAAPTADVEPRPAADDVSEQRR